MRAFSFLLFMLSWFGSFAQEAIYVTNKNINYYTDSLGKQDAYKKEKCVLDIYYPENVKNYSTIIWFHGGGLTGGSKEIPAALTETVHAVIGVGYRLAPKIRAATCISDAAAAVAWVFKHIQEYGGDPDRIFVSGHSAGAYLAMMVSLDKKYLDNYQIDADKIAGIIPFSGHAITHFTIRKEQGLKDTQPTIDEYAPLYHVRAGTPPVLLITGDRELEMLGRYEENAYLARMMKLAGHRQVKLYELDGYGHNMTEPAFPLLLKAVREWSE